MRMWRVANCSFGPLLGIRFPFSSDPSCTLEQEPLQNLAREGQLVAYRHPGFFFAMDTYRELKYLNSLWDSGTAPWKFSMAIALVDMGGFQLFR